MHRCASTADSIAKAAERQTALDYHERPKTEKIEIRATKSMATGGDLPRARWPGVAGACLGIAKTPGDACRYTARANLVAVDFNGTAVLGLAISARSRRSR